MIDYEAKFLAALEYRSFLEQYGSPEHRRRWTDVYDQAALTLEQRQLLAGFTRHMNVLCMAGAWCGDCVQQCPLLQRIAEAVGKIHLRFVDRDADPELAAELRICGGGRVPVVVFLSEDFLECARYGDRTLARYRDMASEQIGAACPTGLVSGAPHGGVRDDWLREFERVQLMLRLSPRLREKHSD